MKPQYKDLIERANKVVEGHHEMNHGAVAQEFADLKAKFDVVEEELVEREDECETDSEDLTEALRAINGVSDVLEYHTGGLTTQL
jgi:hypothetical protein